MEARCLDEPADVGETGEVGVGAIFELEGDGERTFPSTGPHAIGCEIAPRRARRQYLCLAAFP